MSRTPAFYSDPALYEIVHADDTADEVWMLDRVAREHGGGGLSALEPACGTGRYLAGLRRHGWSVAGYDLSSKMVAYARRRLPGADVRRGDMVSFKPGRRYDLVFNLLSTFRHLMTDRDALAHLRVSAAALNPGGVFVLGLDLASYGEDVPDEETWTARRGGRTWRHVMMTLPPDRRRRRERIINFVTRPDGRVLESAYDLRSYDAGELEALLAKSPLTIAAVYDYGGRAARLGGPERALWLVLKPRV